MKENAARFSRGFFDPYFFLVLMLSAFICG